MIIACVAMSMIVAFGLFVIGSTWIDLHNQQGEFLRALLATSRYAAMSADEFNAVLIAKFA